MVKANKKCEWIWQIYFKFAIGYIGIGSTTIGSITSFVWCLYSRGHVELQYLHRNLFILWAFVRLLLHKLSNLNNNINFQSDYPGIKIQRVDILPRLYTAHGFVRFIQFSMERFYCCLFRCVCIMKRFFKCTNIWWIAGTHRIVSWRISKSSASKSNFTTW